MLKRVLLWLKTQLIDFKSTQRVIASLQLLGAPRRLPGLAWAPAWVCPGLALPLAWANALGLGLGHRQRQERRPTEGMQAQ